MAYTLHFAISLGSSQTGLTLEAQLKDTAGANVGAAITTGFAEIGAGNYVWNGATAIPDDHRGSVVFQISPAGAIKAISAINPEETETNVTIWKEILEGALTAKGIMRLLAAGDAGEVSGAETSTVTIKSADAVGKTRLTATVDADGNRSSITKDVTDI